MKLIETYKEKVEELLGYTRMGNFALTQTCQLGVLRNFTFDALDQLELGKPLPEIFENFKHYPFVVNLSFTFDNKVYPLFLYCDDHNRLTAVSTEFQYKNIEDHSEQVYPVK